ncbi:CRISPR-associated endoribonuclease Cas2 [archaeon BMS3Bbin15]|nr:CRISPR-associated endoribonuclease Cas2 [archaeon BMS3Bbin15]
MILVYDIGVERVNKVRGFLRQYLDWVQNSVFEGELTKSAFKKVTDELKEIIEPDLDTIIIYILRDEKFLEKKYIGEPKVKLSNII